MLLIACRFLEDLEALLNRGFAADDLKVKL